MELHREKLFRNKVCFLAARGRGPYSENEPAAVLMLVNLGIRVDVPGCEPGEFLDRLCPS